MNFLSFILIFIILLILVIAVIGFLKLGKRKTVFMIWGMISIVFIILGLLFIMPNMWRNIGVTMLIIGGVSLVCMFILMAK